MRTFDTLYSARAFSNIAKRIAIYFRITEIQKVREKMCNKLEERKQSINKWQARKYQKKMDALSNTNMNEWLDKQDSGTSKKMY